MPTLELSVLDGIARAPAGDNEVDLAALQLELQIVAGKLIAAPGKQVLCRSVMRRRELGERVGVGNEDIDVVADAVIVEDRQRGAAAERPARWVLQGIEQR